MPTSGMAVLGILSKNLIIFEENQSRLQGVQPAFLVVGIGHKTRRFGKVSGQNFVI